MSSDWLPRWSPRPQARIRLFCFSYAGGSASTFRQWPGAFADPVEVVPIELPGHGSRFAETPLVDLGTLATGAADALRPHLDRPFALFGHSFGAFLAFEVARLLGGGTTASPACLVVSASRAPCLAPRRRLAQLPHEVLVESLRALNGTPNTVLQDRQLLELLLPLVRADLEADEEYLIGDGTRLDCPILALGGRGDPTLAFGELASWAQMTSAEFRLLMLPGGHFFLHSFHRTVVTVIEQALDWAAAA